MDNVTRITVFVASPGDVPKERDAVKDIIDDINETGVLPGIVLQLTRWETHAWPGFGEDAQAVINQQIGGYDIFVGIMWNRLGTPTKRSTSGTVEEFERAYALWKAHQRPSLLFYFNRQPFDFDTSEQVKQKLLVVEFRETLRKLGGLYWEYTTIESFTKDLRRHLIQEVKKSQADGAPLGDQKAQGRIQALSKKLGYWHHGPTKRVLQDIEQIAVHSDSRVVKDAAIAVLKDFIGGGLTEDNAQATARAREIRTVAFATLRRCAYEDLGALFKDGELESLDMVRFDFSDQRMAGVSFAAAFAVEAHFERAVLDGAVFNGTWIRNADFAGASLRDADFSGADWFNALHLTADQLRQVKPGTLRRSPQSLDEMHAYARDHYVLPFDSWTAEVQRDLLAAWSEYLEPGGLRDVVNGMT